MRRSVPLALLIVLVAAATVQAHDLKPTSCLRCLLTGKPAADVVVVAGGRTPAGSWYARFISKERRSAEGLTHESTWATVTLAVR